MKAYHLLRHDMRSGFGKEEPWTVGEEREISGELELSHRGYHSSPSWHGALRYAPGPIACIVEVSEPVFQYRGTQVSHKRKLIAARDAREVLRSWACDCAERPLRKARVRDEQAWNAVKAARLYDEDKATKEELAAARKAAKAARDAEWARVWGTEWDMVEEVAWSLTAAAVRITVVAALVDARWAAVWVAAWDVATAAVRDVGRIATSDVTRANQFVTTWTGGVNDWWIAARRACNAETKWQSKTLDWYMRKLMEGEA